MKKVLILSYSYMDRDPRVLRQIAFFESKQFEVYLSSLSYTGNHQFIPLLKVKKGLAQKFLKAILFLFRINRFRLSNFLKNSNVESLNDKVDLVVANDIETWPIAIRLKSKNKNIKVVFDAHEYYPRHFEDVLMWRILHQSFYLYLCNKFIHKADVFMTVCKGIGEEYKKNFKTDYLLVYNAPDFEPELWPNEIDANHIKLIHHGNANPSRKIESMINLMKYLDKRFHLYLMLMPTDKGYLAELKKIASKFDNVTFLDPVPTQEIPRFINKFDMGVFLLDPVNFNYEHALPNKFFEFMQARLGIAIGPSKEMKYILEEQQLGVVSEDFGEASLAKKINSLQIDDLIEFKRNAHKCAQEYSNEGNKRVYEGILENFKAFRK
ncbi:hypothetical protein [Rhodonellum sp.]|uniref:hypothetical protein n=1 Tax=Rhodonellum sp. TaxID=2231180 RepID=UPI00272503D3|nr:hypothetical protein [Rhodonellum sp.]MDO9551436.1 hypothetical protein [Rhodonellum sp.]